MDNLKQAIKQRMQKLPSTNKKPMNLSNYLFGLTCLCLLGLSSCDISNSGGGFNMGGIGCSFDTEVISDDDTLCTPCTVTFQVVNFSCTSDLFSQDLNLTQVNSYTYTAQIDAPGTYSVDWDDNCGAVDCWAYDTYTFTID